VDVDLAVLGQAKTRVDRGAAGATGLAQLPPTD